MIFEKENNVKLWEIALNNFVGNVIGQVADTGAHMVRERGILKPEFLAGRPSLTYSWVSWGQGALE